MKRQDLRRPKRPPSPEMIAKADLRTRILMARRLGLSFKRIASDFGLKVASIRGMLARAHLKGDLTDAQYFLTVNKPALSADEYKAKWIARVKVKAIQNETGCWIWPGATNLQGYGTTGFRSNPVAVHRQMYKLVHGVELKTEQFVCHTCDVRRCCNPDHLWVGSCADNQLDAIAKGRHAEASKTHCDKGHPLSGDNLRMGKQCETSGRKGDRRACKACERGRMRVKAGWPEDLAYSMPPQPLGYTFNPKATGKKANHRVSHEQK